MKATLLLIVLVLSMVSTPHAHVTTNEDLIEHKHLPEVSLEEARKIYAYVLGYEAGQKFSPANNDDRLSLEAYIEGLRASAGVQPASVSEEELRAARSVLSEAAREREQSQR